MPKLSLMTVLLISLLAAGCGGSSSSSTTASTSTPATSSATTSSTASATSSSSSGVATAGSGGAALTAQGVAACKGAIASQTTIPSSFKARLDHICDLAATGNQAAVKKATHDVCVEIIKAKVPVSGQAAAESSCPPA